MTALAVGGGTVRNPLRSDDTDDGTFEALGSFTANVSRENEQVHVRVDQPLQINDEAISARESGTLLRFLMPLVSILPGPEEVLLRGRETLTNRSNREPVESLRDAGLDLEGTGSEQTVPIRCYPGQSPTESPIPVACSSTSQLLSGWLLAVAARGGGELRRTTELVSAPYVEMTERVLEEAGVSVDHPADDCYRIQSTRNPSFDYRVPGDYSSAAFLLVGGLLTDGEVRVQGLRRDDPQADKRIVEILRDLGAKISWEDESEEGGELLCLEGPFDPPDFDVDASDCPDLSPILAVLGVLSEGESHIRNVEHLRNKESNRLTGTAEELRKAGYQVRTTQDSLHLGSIRDDYDFKEAAQLDAREDHRLAMAFSVLGLVRGKIIVTGAECVSKSYPEFYEHFRSLGASFTKE